MFNLTKLEKTIIIFLLSTLVLGLCVAVYRKSHSTAEVILGNFDIENQKPIAKGKININEADIEGLMRLKGVGKVLAQRIIEYRSSKGSFASIDDIKNVKGLGPVIFQKIKDDISIE